LVDADIIAINIVLPRRLPRRALALSKDWQFRAYFIFRIQFVIYTWVNYLICVYYVAWSAACNATWTVYENSNVHGGSRLLNANTVTSCVQGCSTNLRCRAVDYNPANFPGWRCFLHFSVSSGADIGPRVGVSHYAISRDCTGKLTRVMPCLHDVAGSSSICQAGLMCAA